MSGSYTNLLVLWTDLYAKTINDFIKSLFMERKLIGGNHPDEELFLDQIIHRRINEIKSECLNLNRLDVQEQLINQVIKLRNDLWKKYFVDEDNKFKEDF